MKILAVAEFDCAGVLQGHRKVLRELGVDYRVAVHDVYSTFTWVPNWHLSECADEDFDRLRAFAREADILQFHPAIGQPWSYIVDDVRLVQDADDVPFGPIRWEDFPGRRVYYFHGSKNAWKNRGAYADFYSRKGTLFASTLDYVFEMDALYAPPVLDLGHLEPAPLRRDDDPLVIVHAPTDTANCHTDEFRQICTRRGIVYRFVQGKTHEETLRIKTRCNAGFDHLRGAFSVNTVENAALGLVPFVGVRKEYRLWLHEAHGVKLPFPPIETVWDLEDAIRDYDADPDATRVAQLQARQWALSSFSPLNVGLMIKRAYETVLR